MDRRVSGDWGGKGERGGEDHLGAARWLPVILVSGEVTFKAAKRLYSDVPHRGLLIRSMSAYFSGHLTMFCTGGGTRGTDIILQVNIPLELSPKQLTSSLPTLSPHRSRQLPFICGVQTDPEGALWRDPPNYWEQIVWPAYIEAHKHVFENGNWENGASSGDIKDLIIIDELETGMTRAVNQVCEKLKQVVYSN